MNVNVAEEEQDILAPSPSSGPYFQAPPTRELFIELDQCEIPEASLSEGEKKSNPL